MPLSVRQAIPKVMCLLSHPDGTGHCCACELISFCYLETAFLHYKLILFCLIFSIAGTTAPPALASCVSDALNLHASIQPMI